MDFESFFTHILAHELMHGLGPQVIKIGGKESSVRQQLKDKYSAIEEAKADITGLASDVFFDLSQWQFWGCTASLHRRMFFGDVHGGTLVYRRRVWEQLSRYPDASLAEDAVFLRQATARGARLRKLPGAGVFVYLRNLYFELRDRRGSHAKPA